MAGRDSVHDCVEWIERTDMLDVRGEAAEGRGEVRTMKAFSAHMYYGNYTSEVYLVLAETKEAALVKINAKIAEEQYTKQATLDDLYEITEEVETIYTGE